MKYILKTHTGYTIWHRIVEALPTCISVSQKCIVWVDGEDLRVDEIVWNIDNSTVVVWLEDFSQSNESTISGWTLGDI